MYVQGSLLWIVLIVYNKILQTLRQHFQFVVCFYDYMAPTVLDACLTFGPDMLCPTFCSSANGPLFFIYFSRPQTITSLSQSPLRLNSTLHVSIEVWVYLYFQKGPSPESLKFPITQIYSALCNIHKII